MRKISPAFLRKLEEEIHRSETKHRGQLRFIFEGPMETNDPLNPLTPRARALELFAKHGIWDTEENCGILVYVQILDHQIEIIADRGILAQVRPEIWSECCRNLSEHFRNADWEGGSFHVLEILTDLLINHYPRGIEAKQSDNELLNAPVTL